MQGSGSDSGKAQPGAVPFGGDRPRDGDRPGDFATDRTCADQSAISQTGQLLTVRVVADQLPVVPVFEEVDEFDVVGDSDGEESQYREEGADGLVVADR
jgi:hypothetical protein